MYVTGIDHTLWAAPFMEAKRWRHMASNIVESVNATLKPTRSESTIDLLEVILNRTMSQSFARLEDTLHKLSVPEAKYTTFGLKLLFEATPIFD
jgi:hypothetical protein